MTFMNKIIKVALALPIGFAAAFVGGFMHQASFKFFITWYWGFLFAIIFLVSTLRFCNNWSKTKLASALFIPGWLGATYLLSTLTKSGDIVLANDLITKIYLAVAVILLGITAVWPVKN
jgi:hypothetical protein